MSQPLPQAARGSAARKAEEKLREIALSFPGAFEDFPWGHRAIKVNKKIFASLNSDRNGFRMSVKLPRSNHSALLLPFSEPTHYGMGKYGWVTASFGIDETPPLGILAEWIEESYRAIAPKKLIAELDGETAPTTKPRRKKA